MANGQRVDLQVTVIYGHQTRKGLVHIKMGDQDLLMPPSKAREIAGFLLEAAGAAEGDEALMTVLKRIGMEDSQAAQMLMAMREERQKIDKEARQGALQALAFDQHDPDHP